MQNSKCKCKHGIPDASSEFCLHNDCTENARDLIRFAAELLQFTGGAQFERGANA